ncbi:plasmid replication protein [Rummeliibacillus stabekisii]|uniref:plasmid replication protein n=1 Tax=Rummeliibacillus stabekisii TaxID=241244 RepID=UPI001173B03A|nr:plasmid replication protein [Rummeliibacillus stabekisii]MBB5171578.1 cell division GTPase FtsZ [Rummeliibacillus stabekisii]GEL05546.1 hypothetical protein RST01_21730 [Rummeliibacillus stabekisii]
MANRTSRNTLTQNKDVKLSLNFGFMGLGMGGSSIAAACAEMQTDKEYPYKAILVNTNEMDLDKIQVDNEDTEKILIGDGKGASRDINLGEKLFKQHEQIIAKKVNAHFSDRDFIWIVAGLGGGTGTGSVIQAIRVLMTEGFNKKFGLILTLPRDTEGATVLNNALTRLQSIHQAMQGLGSIIIVDNQKLFNSFVEKGAVSTKEYLSFSNNYIARTLHEMNVVTASFKPFSEFHFDSSEFTKLIKTPGILHFVRYAQGAATIDASEPIKYIRTLESKIQEGVLSDGFNIAKTKRLALSILANANDVNKILNVQITKSIEDKLDELAPIAIEKPIAQYVYDTPDEKDVHFYAAFAGLDLPNRVKELIDVNNRFIEEVKKQQENTVENDPFGDFVSSSSSSNTEEEMDGNDAFNLLFNNNQNEASATADDGLSEFEKLFKSNQ